MSDSSTRRDPANGRNSYRKIEHGLPEWWRDVPGLSWIADLLPRWTEFRVTPQLRHVDAVCTRMGQTRCRQTITAEDLGRRIPLAERRKWAVAAAHEFGA